MSIPISKYESLLDCYKDDLILIQEKLNKLELIVSVTAMNAVSRQRCLKEILDGLAICKDGINALTEEPENVES